MMTDCFPLCIDSVQEQIMTGTDLSLIAEEMKKAQEILKKIQEMKSGVIAMGDKRIAVQTSVSSTMSTVCIFLCYGFWNRNRPMNFSNYIKISA